MAVHPYLSKLHSSIDGGTNYVEITNCKMLQPPSMERGTAVTTGLAASNATKTKMGGWIDPGTIPFRFYYSEAQYTALRTLFIRSPNTSVIQWKVTMPLLSGETTAALFIGQGVLTKLGISEANDESDDPYTCEAEITCSGLWTLTPAVTS